MWNDIRNIIIENRQTKKLSQMDLAIMIGKEESYVYCVEKGLIKISEEIIDEIVNALNIDLHRELYLRYRKKFELQNLEIGSYAISRQVGCQKENSQKKGRVRGLEKKTQPTQLMMRPSTKNAIIAYAEKNDISANDLLETLARTYILASKKSELICQYKDITFNPNSNVYIKKDERKSERFQLLLKESTKNGIKEIARERETSLNDIMHKLADSFLYEWYMQA